MSAQSAVEEIIRDLTNRYGLGNEWNQIDEGIRKEIVTAWIEIIVKECNL